MKGLYPRIYRFLADESGPTAVEYAALLMLILLAVLAAVSLMGEATSSSIRSSGDSIQNATGGP